MQEIERRVLEVSTFAALIDDLDYPCLGHHHHLSLTGRKDWEQVLDRSDRQTRRNLLMRLTDVLMTSCPGACARYEAWRLAGSPVADADWIHQHIIVSGDQWVVPMIHEALGRLPNAVRHAVVREAAFVAVGREKAALFLPSLHVGPANEIRAYQICLGPTSDVGIVLHECAHLWVSSCSLNPDEEFVPITRGNQNLESLRQHAAESGWAHRIDQWITAEERIANGLALAWLWMTAAVPEPVALPC